MWASRGARGPPCSYPALAERTPFDCLHAFEEGCEHIRCCPESRSATSVPCQICSGTVPLQPLPQKGDAAGRRHQDYNRSLNSLNSCDFAASRVPEFVRLLCAIPHPRCLQPIRGTVSPGALPRCAGADPPFQPAETGTALFRIILQPEEAALLCAIRDGLCPADEVPGSVLLSLMALRMLKCDEHGNPTLTDLAEAALERISGKLH